MLRMFVSNLEGIELGNVLHFAGLERRAGVLVRKLTELRKLNLVLQSHNGAPEQARDYFDII